MEYYTVTAFSPTPHGSRNKVALALASQPTATGQDAAWLAMTFGVPSTVLAQYDGHGEAQLQAFGPYGRAYPALCGDGMLAAADMLISRHGLDEITLHTPIGPIRAYREHGATSLAVPQAQFPAEPVPEALALALAETLRLAGEYGRDYNILRGGEDYAVIYHGEHGPHLLQQSLASGTLVTQASLFPLLEAQHGATFHYPTRGITLAAAIPGKDGTPRLLAETYLPGVDLAHDSILCGSSMLYLANAMAACLGINPESSSFHCIGIGPGGGSLNITLHEGFVHLRAPLSPSRALSAPSNLYEMEYDAILEAQHELFDLLSFLKDEFLPAVSSLPSGEDGLPLRESLIPGPVTNHLFGSLVSRLDRLSPQQAMRLTEYLGQPDHAPSILPPALMAAWHNGGFPHPLAYIQSLCIASERAMDGHFAELLAESLYRLPARPFPGRREAMLNLVRHIGTVDFPYKTYPQLAAATVGLINHALSKANQSLPPLIGHSLQEYTATASDAVPVELDAGQCAIAVFGAGGMPLEAIFMHLLTGTRILCLHDASPNGAEDHRICTDLIAALEHGGLIEPGFIVSQPLPEHAESIQINTVLNNNPNLICGISTYFDTTPDATAKMLAEAGASFHHLRQATPRIALLYPDASDERIETLHRQSGTPWRAVSIPPHSALWMLQSQADWTLQGSTQWLLQSLASYNAGEIFPLEQLRGRSSGQSV